MFVNTIDGPQEYIIFTLDTGIDGDVVLHFDIFSQYHIWRNDNILSDVTVFANYAVWHDMTEMPDLCSAPILEPGSTTAVGWAK
jgi:hypothetical protein